MTRDTGQPKGHGPHGHHHGQEGPQEQGPGQEHSGKRRPPGRVPETIFGVSYYENPKLAAKERFKKIVNLLMAQINMTLTEYKHGPSSGVKKTVLVQKVSF